MQAEGDMKTVFEVGKPLPAWNLTSIDGKAVPKKEDFLGAPLLILFINLGCPGCKGRALPYANRIVYENKRVQVLGIHSNFEGRSFSDLELNAAVKDFYVRFPMFQDAGEAETFHSYEALGTPHWILVDAQGNVAKAMFGSDPNNALLRLDLQIQEMLEV